MKTDLKQGDILYRGDLTEYKVSKVSNKYFECEGCKYKFIIETLKSHNPNYTNAEFQLYADKQSLLDEKEISDLEDEIRKMIKHYGRTVLSLEQLRKISEIINNK